MWQQNTVCDPELHPLLKNIVKKDIIGATDVLGIWPIEQATVLFDVKFPEFVNSTVLIQYSCSSEVHNEVLSCKGPGACNKLPNGSKNTVHIIYRYRQNIDKWQVDRWLVHR